MRTLINRPITIARILHTIESALSQLFELKQILFQLGPRSFKLRYALFLFGCKRNKLPMVSFRIGVFPVLHQTTVPIMPKRFSLEIFCSRNHPIVSTSTSGRLFNIIMGGHGANDKRFVQSIERLNRQLFSYIDNPISTIHTLHFPIGRKIISVFRTTTGTFREIAKTLVLDADRKVIASAHNTIIALCKLCGLRKSLRKES